MSLAYLFMIVAGVFVGIMGGMFGFGGSSLSTPILRVFFGVAPYLALASPLPMTLLSSSISSVRYNREGLVDWKIAKTMLVVLVPGSLIGAYVTRYISGHALMMLTAVFLVYVAVRFIVPSKKKRRQTAPGLYMVLISGFFIGFFSGVLANGGGIFIVPVLMLLGLDIKQAIGTSMIMVFFIAIPSILVHWYLGHIDWLISLLLSVGALPGAYAGSYVTVKINREKLQKIYGVFLFVFAVYFAISEL